MLVVRMVEVEAHSAKKPSGSEIIDAFAHAEFCRHYIGTAQPDEQANPAGQMECDRLFERKPSGPRTERRLRRNRFERLHRCASRHALHINDRKITLIGADDDVRANPVSLIEHKQCQRVKRTDVLARRIVRAFKSTLEPCAERRQELAGVKLAQSAPGPLRVPSKQW